MVHPRHRVWDLSAVDTPAPLHSCLGQRLQPGASSHTGQEGKAFWGQFLNLFSFSFLWRKDCLPEQSHRPHRGLGKPYLAFQNPQEACTADEETQTTSKEPTHSKTFSTQVQNSGVLTWTEPVASSYSLQGMDSRWYFQQSCPGPLKTCAETIKTQA